ncbi:MAG: hypothetical protein KF768_08400 [Phycisphaeraceae bacterium]|nr:hypothetical protein [Phycisphaeraceae bacterium]
MDATTNSETRTGMPDRRADGSRRDGSPDWASLSRLAKIEIERLHADVLSDAPHFGVLVQLMLNARGASRCALYPSLDQYVVIDDDSADNALSLQLDGESRPWSGVKALACLISLAQIRPLCDREVELVGRSCRDLHPCLTRRLGRTWADEARDAALEHHPNADYLTSSYRRDARIAFACERIVNARLEIVRAFRSIGQEGAAEAELVAVAAGLDVERGDQTAWLVLRLDATQAVGTEG